MDEDRDLNKPLDDALDEPRPDSEWAARLSAKETENARLKADLIRLRRAAQGLRERHADVLRRLQAAEAAGLPVAATSDESESEEALRTRVDELSARLLAKGEEVQELRRRLEKTEQGSADVTLDLRKLEEDGHRWRQRAVDAENEIMARAEASDAEREQMQGLMDRLRKEREEARAERRSVEQRLAERDANLGALPERVRELEARLAAKEAEVERLLAERIALDEARTRLERERAELSESQRSDGRLEIEGLERRLHEMERERDKSARRITSLEAEQFESAAREVALDRRRIQLEIRVRELERDAEAVKNAANDERKTEQHPEILRLRREMEENEARLGLTEDELDRTRVLLETVQHQLAEALLVRAEREGEKAGLMHRLASLDDALQAREHEVRRMRILLDRNPMETDVESEAPQLD